MLLLVHTTTQTFRSLALPSELHAVPHGSNSMLSELCITQTWDVVWQYLRKGKVIHHKWGIHTQGSTSFKAAMWQQVCQFSPSPCQKLPSLTPLLPPCEEFAPSVHGHVTGEGEEAYIKSPVPYNGYLIYSSVPIFTSSLCFLSPCSIDRVYSAKSPDHKTALQHNLCYTSELVEFFRQLSGLVAPELYRSSE